MVGVRDTQEVILLTFIEKKEKYIYIELGLKKFATLVVKNDQPQKNERKKSRGRDEQQHIGCLPGRI